MQNDQQFGPVDEAKIKELIASGAIHAGTMVWSEGMPNWLPISQTPLSGLVANLHPAPPPLPTSMVYPPSMPVSVAVQSVQGAGAGAKALHDTARAFLVGGILSIVTGIITTAVGWFFGIFTVIVGIIELVHAYQYWPTPPRKRTNATFVPILEMIGAIGGSGWSIFIGIGNLNRLNSGAVKAYFQALQSGQPVDLITSAAVAGAPALPSTKKCPGCGNNIPLDATICQFCQHDFSENQEDGNVTIQVNWAGAFAINEQDVLILMDNTVVGTGSFNNGFRLQLRTTPGVHTISTNALLGIRTPPSVIINTIQNKNYQVKLDYSRAWGNFKMSYSEVP
jgi:hypothetical protein